MPIMLRPLLTLLLSTLLISHIPVPEVSAAVIISYNKCPHPVWPGIQPSAGKPLLARGVSTSHQTRPTPSNCQLFGQAASGVGMTAPWTLPVGGTPPATLAEITLGNDQDFYDVSLVDGYNLPISITPLKGSGKCSFAGCVRDLNRICPVGLQGWSDDKKRVVACRSACSAFNLPKYCCTGSYGSPQACKPTAYSMIFKTACPKA